MATISALSRDVSRAQLPGIKMPAMGLEMDEIAIRLQPRDLQNQYRPLCGRINIVPSATQWYDGSVLQLHSLTMVVESDDGMYCDTATMDTTAIRSRWEVNPKDNSPIQFGSIQADSKGTLCPFAIRLPAFPGKRTFYFKSRATFTRGAGPATPNSPAQLELSSNVVAIPVSC